MSGHRPHALLAEVTYRCPLHCPYCSNPVSYPAGQEITAADWARVFHEAAALGVLQVGFSGGEPLARRDLPELIAAARRAGLYTNLITSGLGLTATRAGELRAAGLDSVQLSLQADEPLLADRLAGAEAHRQKLAAAECIRNAGLPLSLNVVLHRENIARLPGIVALAVRLGAQRLELANTQYYGWAFRNRAALLPTREQVERARAEAEEAKARCAGRLEIFYVLPDYYEEFPKPCLAGWGRRYLTVNPVGEVLPCPTAASIPGLVFENVRTRSLAEIWHHSESFERFRGTAWLPEPCHSCPRREIDFGGCRCQAALLAGDPAVTDPVCRLSPLHQRVVEILGSVPAAKWTARQNPPLTQPSS